MNGYRLFKKKNQQYQHPIQIWMPEQYLTIKMLKCLKVKMRRNVVIKWLK